MAGWASLVEKLVNVADKITATLQANVSHYAFSGATVDVYEKVTPGAPVVRACVVESTRRLFRLADGTEVLSRTKLTFPRPVAVDPRDKFVLPDGTTGPILDVVGVVDPVTNALYATEVFLG